MPASKKRAPPPSRPNEQQPAGHDATAMQVLRRFRVVFNAVKAHFREVEKSVGLGGAKVWALGIIEERPGISVSALARQMDIHQSTASNLIKALVDADLVELQRCGADRRSVQLHTRPAARRLLERAPLPRAGVLPAALSSLDTATLTRLDDDLREVERALASSRHAGKIPLAEM